MKRLSLSILFLLGCFTLFSQSVSEIKADKNYLSGEGWGTTLKQADDAYFLDTSDLSIEEVADKIIKIVEEKVK